MRDQEIIGLQEAYLEVHQVLDEAKDETEEGITGLPIPKKKMSPAKRHEFEKKRREARKERNDPRAGDSFSQHRMTGSRGHGSEYSVPSRLREDFVISYLLDEGFASDEKSAEAILGAMSEEWKQSIVEAKEDEGLSPLVKRQTRNDRIRSEVSSSDPEAHTEPELENSRRVMHKAMRGQKKPEAKSRPTGPGKYGAMQRRGMGVSDKFRKEVLKRKLN